MKWLVLGLSLAAILVDAKCNSKCHKESSECIALHGDDDLTVVDQCIEERAGDKCKECRAKDGGKPENPRENSASNLFLCLNPCRWVAIHCTQAGINASNLLELMTCVTESYQSEVNKAKAPRCEECIIQGECRQFCEQKLGVVCNEKQIKDNLEECKEWKNQVDVCSQYNKRTCESFPVCSVHKGECVRTDSIPEDEKKDDDKDDDDEEEEEEKIKYFKSVKQYANFCKQTYKGEGEKENCIACGGKWQKDKKSCKVKEKRALCNQISMPDVCKRAKCKAAYADKAQKEFKRCVNSGEEIFEGKKK